MLGSSEEIADKNARIDDLARRIVLATQDGLPRVAMPYHSIASMLGEKAETVMQTILQMLEDGSIRRIGVVPNHYRLGYVANGMSVWDVPDTLVDSVGAKVGQVDYVSHCYRRPRHPPDWPYNLFAMIHGKTRAEVYEKVDEIAEMLGDSVRGCEVLFSTRILKKTGVRIGG